MYQTMWDEVKIALGITFIALNAYVGNKEKYLINSLSSCPKKLEQEEQNKPKASRGKETMNKRT